MFPPKPISNLREDKTVWIKLGDSLYPEHYTHAERMLLFIERFIAANSKPPTVREIARQMGYTNFRLVTDRLKMLQRDGYLAKTAEVEFTANNPRKKRGIKLTAKRLP